MSSKGTTTNNKTNAKTDAKTNAKTNAKTDANVKAKADPKAIEICNPATQEKYGLKNACANPRTGVTSIAHPYCIVEHSNLGFKPKITDPSICTTYSCPPGWEKSGTSCKKPLVDAIINKRSHCDERWNDWFTIPNYHLGNNHMSISTSNQVTNTSNITCYSPCDTYSVPGFQTDPVDGENLSFFTNKDELTRCVKRDEYFSGKYALGGPSSDYCPSAWIHRIQATEANLKDKKYMDKTYGSNSYNIANIATDAVTVSSTIGNTMMPNIQAPPSTIQNACNKMNTVQRILPAHKMCSDLFNNPEDTYEKMYAANGNDNEVTDAKVSLMQQACNAVFCNPNDTALDVISEDPICFPNPPKINPLTGKQYTADDEPYPDAPQPVPQSEFLRASFRIAILCIVVPIAVYMSWLFWTNILYPHVIKRSYRNLMVLLKLQTRDHYNIIDRAEAKINTLKEMRNNITN